MGQHVSSSLQYIYFLHFLCVAVSSDVSIPDPFEVVFTPGQTSSNSCIAIPITSDKDVEGDQYFSISISSAETPPNVLISSPSVAYITIVDNDKSNDIMENDNDITVNTTDDGKLIQWNLL